MYRHCTCTCTVHAFNSLFFYRAYMYVYLNSFLLLPFPSLLPLYFLISLFHFFLFLSLPLSLSPYSQPSMFTLLVHCALYRHSMVSVSLSRRGGTFLDSLSPPTSLSPPSCLTAVLTRRSNPLYSSPQWLNKS